MAEPIIEQLTAEWASITALAASLADDEWDLPTALPGWSVKDNISHVIGIESMLLGDPAPDVDVSHIDRIADDPFGASIESWVEARRATPGPEVAAELDTVVARRTAQLEAMTDDEWAAVGWSPIGEVPYRRFMVVRVFDCWMHEQDIRRATGREGHLEGPCADTALGHFTTALGFVVGKKAGAPQGSSVVFEVVGPQPRTLRGRGRGSGHGRRSAAVRPDHHDHAAAGDLRRAGRRSVGRGGGPRRRRPGHHRRHRARRARGRQPGLHPLTVAATPRSASGPVRRPVGAVRLGAGSDPDRSAPPSGGQLGGRASTTARGLAPMTPSATLPRTPRPLLRPWVLMHSTASSWSRRNPTRPSAASEASMSS